MGKRVRLPPLVPSGTGQMDKGANAIAEKEDEEEEEEKLPSRKSTNLSDPGTTEKGPELADGTPKERRISTLSGRFQMAGNKIMAANKVASAFVTLRDQKEVNELHPRQLHTIKQLGEGAFATVSLCVLLPGASLNRSFTVPGHARGGPGNVRPSSWSNKSFSQPNARISRDFGNAAALAHTSETKPLVAVKCLKPGTSIPAEDFDSFVREAALTRKLKHRYIVDYIGVGYNDDSSEKAKQESMFIVQEYMNGGTLKSKVSKQMLSPSNTVYSNKQALEWMLQLAEALAYLHSANPKVIHRDLKLENVLLTSRDQAASQQIAKLADFGLVAFVRKAEARKAKANQIDPPKMPSKGMQEQKRLMNGAQAAMQHMGTFERPSMLNKLKRISTRAPILTKINEGNQDKAHSKSAKLQSSVLQVNVGAQLSGRTGSYMYMSPEMFRNEDYSEKVDVFSFGVMLYEVIHRYLVICSISNQGTQEEIEDYARVISMGYRPPLGDNCPTELRDLIRSCWAQNPSDRPSMDQVVQKLKAMLENGIVESMPAEAGCCVIQ
eukprot:CAMPEP_0202342260 /NCGR_PEP_ID=MMETSP1126-20121109/2900_1 /ASSEMBLY_ACC=CAM_ASM_000457 /TAXON_ID=3047 /ORGANISM="Dunaliella tertiolecta, Strain CCMP1320" /LENGTH=550 /DNA_ID=CAMNT_0048933189 /DNA_START=45 /DNA_END=1697 /DNA_ORIENTATION=+